MNKKLYIALLFSIAISFVVWWFYLRDEFVIVIFWELVFLLFILFYLIFLNFKKRERLIQNHINQIESKK